MQRNQGKQQNGKDERSRQENWKKKEKIKGLFHPKMGTIKDRIKDQEEMARIHRRTVQKRS